MPLDEGGQNTMRYGDILQDEIMPPVKAKPKPAKKPISRHHKILTEDDQHITQKERINLIAQIVTVLGFIETEREFYNKFMGFNDEQFEFYLTLDLPILNEQAISKIRLQLEICKVMIDEQPMLSPVPIPVWILSCRQSMLNMAIEQHDIIFEEAFGLQLDDYQQK